MTKKKTTKEEPKNSVTKRAQSIKQGKVYVNVDGTLTRNYIVSGGKRTYVHATTASQIASDTKNA